jgi:hypothetical protein
MTVLCPAGMFSLDESTRLYWFAEGGADIDGDADMNLSTEFELLVRNIIALSSLTEPSLSFRVQGTVVGLALYNSVLLSLSFPKVLFKLLLGKMPTLRDLKVRFCDLLRGRYLTFERNRQESFPVVGRGLQELLDFQGKDKEFKDTFCLNFQVGRFLPCNTNLTHQGRYRRSRCRRLAPCGPST